MGDAVAQRMMMDSHGITHNMIRMALVVGGALRVGGFNAITASSGGFKTATTHKVAPASTTPPSSQRKASAAPGCAPGRPGSWSDQ